jgi:FAD/FMN-containing dehydrogenase
MAKERFGAWKNQTSVHLTQPSALDAFLAGLGDIPHDTAPNVVAAKSRDFFWYSPILKERLADCLGDVVVTPRSEADVVAIARLCAAHRVPLTARGGGTGNYGQAVPLHGGVVLDLTGLAAIGPLVDGTIRVGPGAKLKDIDLAARPQGWELRMFPSTYRTATIGGFVAGGSGGIGSITYGVLSERGAIAGARVVTCEAEPRVVELRGYDAHRVQHAYGTNGIITELEIPLAPAQPWVEIAIAFTDFMQLARFAETIGRTDGIMKKLITAVAWPIPRSFGTLKADVPEGSALGLFMIAAATLGPFFELVEAFGGETVYRRTDAEVAASGAVPIFEYTWNHTTLQVLKRDRDVTYLQSAFPSLELVAEMNERFGDEVMQHLEFVRSGGELAIRALQVVRYTTAERLNEIIRIHEERGCPVFNPHTYVIEDGGRKITDPAQLAFKRVADPQGLLNPGKMRGWTPA